MHIINERTGEISDSQSLNNCITRKYHVEVMMDVEVVVLVEVMAEVAAQVKLVGEIVVKVLVWVQTTPL
jgi:hypothetical protein